MENIAGDRRKIPLFATPSEWFYRAVFQFCGNKGPLRNKTKLTLHEYEDGLWGETNLFLIGTEEQLYDSRHLVESLLGSSVMPWHDRDGSARNKYYFGELYNAFYKGRRDDRIAFFWWQPCWVPQISYPPKIHVVRAFEKLQPKVRERLYNGKEFRDQYDRIIINDYKIQIPLAIFQPFRESKGMRFMRLPRVRGGIRQKTQSPVSDIIYHNMLVGTEEFGDTIKAGHRDLVDLPLVTRIGKLACYEYYILRMCRLEPRGGHAFSDCWLECLAIGLSHYDGCVTIVESMFTSFNAYVDRYPNLAGALASLLKIPLAL